MSESFENVLRRIEVKFASVADEVARLRAENELLARELHRVRTEHRRLLAKRPPAATEVASAPAPTAEAASTTRLSDADWHRLRGG